MRMPTDITPTPDCMPAHARTLLYPLKRLPAPGEVGGGTVPGRLVRDRHLRVERVDARDECVKQFPANVEILRKVRRIGKELGSESLQVRLSCIWRRAGRHVVEKSLDGD